MKRTLCVCTIIAIVLVTGSIALAEEVHQWRGRGRDGIYYESGLLQSWPEDGPPLLWSTEEAGDGYSSPAVADGRLFITGIDDEHEFCTCFDLTGKKLWRRDYSPVWDGSFPSARTTPTIVGDKLYVISATGVVACLETTTGEIVWSVDAFKKFEGDYGRWGVSEAPIVDEGKVYCTVGGNKTTVVAFSAKDGAVVWQSPSLKDTKAYVSPELIEYKGKKQLAIVLSTYIAGVDPETGAIPWKIDYESICFEDYGNPQRRKINCNTPVFHDGRLYVTSGYDHASVMLQLSPDLSSATVLWKDRHLDTHHGHVVLVDGHLYGANWLNNNDGNWLCLDWNTGKVLFEKEWHCKGCIIYADGHFYCYEEKRGNFALVKANPKGFTVVSSFRVRKGSGKHWSHPIISKGILYHRRGEALMAYNIRQ